MARIVSIFQFTGRAGSAVGSKGKNGRINLRQYQPTVSNPRTAAQMSTRAKLKLASQVAAMLGEVGRTALLANGLRKTDRGKLVSKLLQNVRVNSEGTQASLAYDLNLVDNPSYKRSLTLAITSEANAYKATFTGAQEGEVIAKCIMVHDVKTGNWRHASVMDTNSTISLGKSASESGDALEVFAYGIVLMPKTNEGFNNVGQTAADEAGYVIDLSKVSTTNYDFSPNVSAALNVEGSASTPTGGGSTPSSESSNNSGAESGSNSGDGVAAPTISGTATFTDSTQVTISGPDGASVYYTTDGSAPSSASTPYSEPFTLNATATVKAVAIKDGVSSTVAQKTFTKASGGDGI